MLRGLYKYIKVTDKPYGDDIFSFPNSGFVSFMTSNLKNLKLINTDFHKKKQTVDWYFFLNLMFCDIYHS